MSVASHAETRKFTRGLGKPGTAAELRQSVSEAVRTSVLVVKPRVVEPLDYESVLVQRKTQILSDGLRDIVFLLQVCTLPRQIRTFYRSIPPHALREAQSLFVQECIKSYISDWHVVNYKYEDYSGDFRQLPKVLFLPQNLFICYYQHYVMSMHVFVFHVSFILFLFSMQSFKRRYFHLTQLGDGSYNLNFYKDEKINKEPKGTIFLDSCMGVVQNSRVRRFAFELKMQDKSGYVLAADSESEMDDWISTLNKILNSSFELAMQDKRNGDLHDDDEQAKSDHSSSSMDSFQSARDIESKMRNETRLKLFTLDPDLQKLDFSGIEPDVKPFEERFGKRILVNCNDLSFNLQSCVAENEEGPTTNVEPFFVSLSLFDIQSGRKISSDFHVDMNHPSVKVLLPPSGAHSRHTQQEIPSLSTGVFSVTCPHPDIFLVARIEKVLQGGIAHCAEPYMKSSDSAKAAQKVLKNAKMACSRLGQYRMPFAWAARPLFKDASGTVDKSARFSALYRQDGNKLSNEDMFRLLADFKKPEKMAKLPVILGNLDVTVDNVAPDLTNCVTPSYLPLRQTEVADWSRIVFEVEEFVPSIAKCSQPFTIYNNHLYVYPRHLRYDNQKSFTKARNIALCLEFRDSDEEDALPLKCIYGRPGGPLFCKKAFAPVLHHQQNPEFYEEFKIELPAQLTDRHHLLFTLYHISCDSNSKASTKRREQVETQGETHTHIRPSESSLIGCIILFCFVLLYFLFCFVWGVDQHLHNFFHHCQSIESTGQSGGELIKYLKSLHAMEAHVMVKFLPTILNQLFRVLTISSQDDVAVNVTRSVLYCVCYSLILVRFHFHSFIFSNLMCFSYSWYFFEVLVKSMAQYLIETGKAKVSRNQRFSASFYHSVETLVTMLVPHITQKYKDYLDATRNANHSLAVFIKVSRAILMCLIKIPCNCTTLYEFKFEFLKVVCNHEHYVPLNLPMPFGKGRIQRFQDLQLDYSLTDDFCKNHFLVGLLLREVGGAVQEFRDIRQIAVQVLKNLMIKHAFDDRYSSKGQQARLATLYLPLFSLLLENVHRLNIKDVPPVTTQTNIVRLTPSNGRDDHVMMTPTKNMASPVDSSLHKEVFGVISGTGETYSVRHTDSRNSLISTDSGNGLSERSIDKPHPLDKGLVSGVLGSSLLRCDKLDQSEVKNILMCFLHVLKSMSEDALFNYWNKASPTDLMNFFSLLEMCLHQFRYMGKRHIARTVEGSGPVVHERRSQTLPVSRSRTGALHMRLQQLNSLDNSYTYNHNYSHSDADVLNQSLLEGNIATEVCLTVLDTLSIFIVGFKTQLSLDHGHNPLMKKVFQVHLCFLQINQSETALKQVFTSLRTFIYKFPCTFFEGRADMCASFCYEILKCCNSKLSSIRSDAAHLLYFLMKSNFDYTGRKSFVRTHLQVVIGVSQLIADVIGIGGTRFQQSLSIINNCANSDKTIKNTAFPSEVKDLTKKIRTVLMATAQMKEHERDPEMLVDLQYSLAKSYASTPELRKTWLDSMARIHVKNGDLSEVHHTQPHTSSCVFNCGAYVLWFGSLQAAMCYKRRDFERLAHLYDTLHRAYSKVTEVMHTGKRLLGTYFRVAFFGQGFFEDEDGKEYIYKEPKFTPLSEISQRLLKLYSDKFGAENVKMIQDSGKINPKDLDSKYAYIQVTHVTPFLEEKELLERKTDFERSHNIRRFVFEMPFTVSGKKQGGIEEQCKRRTILTTTHCFPYVKKRIAVMYQHHVDLNPIEVAIDEMSKKVLEIRQLCSCSDVDMIQLQLKLQGSISVQVLSISNKCFPDKISQQFVEACGLGLGINERLIKEDQQEYHDEMKANYRDLIKELSAIMHEPISAVDDGMRSPLPDSLHIFNAISGTPTAASIQGLPNSSSVV
uniref:Dedicator of cytokinesis 9 n=1 Tax=Cyprinus carpio TaxID=7962 RepID=A0A8C1NT49_CYPCA